MSTTPKVYTRKAVQPEEQGQGQQNPSDGLQVIETQQALSIHKQHSGPLPAPETLKQYNDILPGAADRIISMAEEAAGHRRKMESGALTATVEEGERKHVEIRAGQKYGLWSTLAAFGVASLALLLGYPTVAGTICGVVVVSLSTVFVMGKKAGKREHAPDEHDSTEQEGEE